MKSSFVVCTRSYTDMLPRINATRDLGALSGIITVISLFLLLIDTNCCEP